MQLSFHLTIVGKHEKLKPLQSKKHYKKAEVKNMSKLYILSAFSLSMIPYQGWVHLYLKEVSPEEAKKVIAEAESKGKEVISAVGHASTAQVLSQLLGREVPVNRAMVSLEDGDEAIVFQLMTRLPEGKVLDQQELQQLLNEGKIKLFHIQLSTTFY